MGCVVGRSAVWVDQRSAKSFLLMTRVSDCREEVAGNFELCHALLFSANGNSSRVVEDL